jgi:hypothetical protein
VQYAVNWFTGREAGSAVVGGKGETAPAVGAAGEP